MINIKLQGCLVPVSGLIHVSLTIFINNVWPVSSPGFYYMLNFSYLPVIQLFFTVNTPQPINAPYSPNS